MGFGHRVYKVRDRVRTCRRGGNAVDAAGLATRRPMSWQWASNRSRCACWRSTSRRRPQTNVEYYTALLLHSLGLQTEQFAPTFGVSRWSAGWRTASSNWKPAHHPPAVRVCGTGESGVGASRRAVKGCESDRVSDWQLILTSVISNHSERSPTRSCQSNAGRFLACSLEMTEEAGGCRRQQSDGLIHR